MKKEEELEGKKRRRFRPFNPIVRDSSERDNFLAEESSDNEGQTGIQVASPFLCSCQFLLLVMFHSAMKHGQAVSTFFSEGVHHRCEDADCIGANIHVSAHYQCDT